MDDLDGIFGNTLKFSKFVSQIRNIFCFNKLTNFFHSIEEVIRSQKVTLRVFGYIL